MANIDDSANDSIPFWLIGLGGGIAILAVRAIGWRGEGAGAVALFLGSAAGLFLPAFLPKRCNDWYRALTIRDRERLNNILGVVCLVLLLLVIASVSAT